MSAREPWAADLAELSLRPAGREDRDRIGRFLAAMDREGLYQRHFAHGEAPNLELLRRVDALDHRDRVALLAVAPQGRVLGHAEYVADHGAVEFAFMVLPQFRVRGIGSRLLRALLDVATAAGQGRMHGMIQASNTRALQLVLKHGFRVLPGGDATVVIVSRELAPAPEATPAQGADPCPLPLIRHDPDRTPLHRRPGSGTPLWTGGG